jgi:hypothetical protein
MRKPLQNAHDILTQDPYTYNDEPPRITSCAKITRIGLEALRVGATAASAIGAPVYYAYTQNCSENENSSITLAAVMGGMATFFSTVNFMFNLSDSHDGSISKTSLFHLTSYSASCYFQFIGAAACVNNAKPLIPYAAGIGTELMSRLGIFALKRKETNDRIEADLESGYQQIEGNRM